MEAVEGEGEEREEEEGGDEDGGGGTRLNNRWVNAPTD